MLASPGLFRIRREKPGQGRREANRTLRAPSGSRRRSRAIVRQSTGGIRIRKPCRSHYMCTFDRTYLYLSVVCLITFRIQGYKTPDGFIMCISHKLDLGNFKYACHRNFHLSSHLISKKNKSPCGPDMILGFLSTSLW